MICQNFVANDKISSHEGSNNNKMQLIFYLHLFLLVIHILLYYPRGIIDKYLILCRLQLTCSYLKQYDGVLDTPRRESNIIIYIYIMLNNTNYVLIAGTYQ